MVDVIKKEKERYKYYDVSKALYSKASYTESNISYGNYETDKYEFISNISITYD